jgi:L-threonylcarbamoyladenylate synthase
LLDIHRSIKILQKGGVISFATDTVYALACDAQNFEAIEKIYQIKNRDRSKFLGILVSKTSNVEKICHLSKQEKEFLEKFYDQGLTLILDKKIEFPKYIGDKKSIAIRVANNDFSKRLTKDFDGLIAMTSLNIAGKKEIISFKEAWHSFSDKIDFIVDSEGCKFQQQSTIVRFVDDKIKILRKGACNIFHLTNNSLDSKNRGNITLIKP